MLVIVGNPMCMRIFVRFHFLRSASEPFTEVVEWGFGDSSLRHAAATAQGTEANLARGGDPY